MSQASTVCACWPCCWIGMLLEFSWYSNYVAGMRYWFCAEPSVCKLRASSVLKTKEFFFLLKSVGVLQSRSSVFIATLLQVIELIRDPSNTISKEVIWRYEILPIVSCFGFCVIMLCHERKSFQLALGSCCAFCWQFWCGFFFFSFFCFCFFFGLLYQLVIFRPPQKIHIRKSNKTNSLWPAVLFSLQNSLLKRL